MPLFCKHMWVSWRKNENLKRTQDLVEVGVVETDDPVGGHKRKCQDWIVKQGEPKHIFFDWLFCVYEFLYNHIRRHKSPRACIPTLILFFPLCCVECNISFFCAIYPLNQNTFGTSQGASSLCFSNPHWLWGGNIKINSSFGYNTVLTQDASLPQVKVPVASKWKG